MSGQLGHDHLTWVTLSSRIQLPGRSDNFISGVRSAVVVVRRNWYLTIVNFMAGAHISSKTTASGHGCGKKTTTEPLTKLEHLFGGIRCSFLELTFVRQSQWSLSYCGCFVKITIPGRSENMREREKIETSPTPYMEWNLSSLLCIYVWVYTANKKPGPVTKHGEADEFPKDWDFLKWIFFCFIHLSHPIQTLLINSMNLFIAFG